MRVSAKQYAEQNGLHEETVTRWCRNSLLPEPQRNKNYPPIAARKIGRNWRINVEGTEAAQLAKCGNSLEKALIKSEMKK